MIKTLAFTPLEGWVFLETEGKIYLSSPPYQRELAKQASPGDVERALRVAGYEGHSRDFPSWEEMVRHLSEQMQQARLQRGEIEPDEVVRRLLRFADEKRLSRMLDRVRDELFREEKYQEARSFLDAMEQHAPGLNDAHRARIQDLKAGLPTASLPPRRFRPKNLDGNLPRGERKPLWGCAA